eukprot:g5637.t1
MRGIVSHSWMVTRALPVHQPKRVLTRPYIVRGIFCVKRPEDRFPFDKPIQNEIFEQSEGLYVSLYAPIKDLPPDGRVITEKEEKCDPLIQRCKTPTYVYETPCPMCKATGMIESKFKGKRLMHTCLACHGLGYVRRVTTRFVPEVSEDGQGPNWTLRPELMNGKHHKNDMN